jgi:small GTP-binding protein
MPLPRLIILFIGVTLILGLMLWLVNSLYRLYIQVAFTAPFLANILLFLLIILLGLIIYYFLYYFVFNNSSKGRKNSRQKRVSVKLPAEKNLIAADNLQALKQQLSQIEDTVAQKVLLEKSAQIEANLTRGDLKLVVFGTGSAGKTSLVNALLGEIAGNVAATMGTTEVQYTYQLKLRGINREILITDTPGILEVGNAGSDRDKLARQLATEADLLLFVIDNDLRQSEYAPLETLASIGKRSLLIFNKIDLYTETEVEEIMATLKNRVSHFINANDVIAVTANPQPVQLEEGEMITPTPEITSLIRRLVAVLRAEGDDLLADNILLQSQRLGEEARAIIDSQRRKQALQIIDRYQWIGAGVIAVTPLPVVDMLATAAVNAQMVSEIGQVYGCEINTETGKDLAVSLGKTLISLGVVKGAVDLLARALQLNFTTYLVGKAIQGVTAAYLTRIAGKSFIEYFRQDQDWGDGGITEVVQRQFELSRKDEFVKGFVKEAIALVVKPISENLAPLENWEDDWERKPQRNEEEW